MEKMVYGAKIMKIGIVSDTHNDVISLEKIIEKHNEVDVWFHAGDGSEDCIKMKELFPMKKFFFVKGNTDHSPEVPYEIWVKLGGVQIWLVHGHREKVKDNLYELKYIANKGEAELTFFGHTHSPYLNKMDNGWLINPGSLKTGSTYGIIEIQKNKKFTFSFYQLS